MLDIKIKESMFTGNVAFFKMVLYSKLENFYNEFSRRREKQMLFPLGDCMGPDGKGPPLELDLRVSRTTNPDEVYFRLENVVGHAHLIGTAAKVPKDIEEEIIYGASARLASTGDI